MGIGLVAYSFKVKERRNSDNTYENLDDVNCNDMLDFVNSFLNNYMNEFYTNDENKKAFKVETINIDRTNRKISGILTSGDAGIPAQIRNIHTPEEISYIKEEDDSECVPLYYLFHLPTNTSGVLILEKFGSKSAKSILNQLLRVAFNVDYSNYTLNIKPLAQGELIQKYFQEGVVKQMTLVSFKSPGERIEDKYASNGQDVAERALYEFTIKARRNKDIAFIKDLMQRIYLGNSNLSTMTDLIGIQDYEPSQVKITFNIRGQQKTIKLDQKDELSAVYDISDEFENKHQHPTYEQLHPLAIEYLTSLLGNQS